MPNIFGLPQQPSAQLNMPAHQQYSPWSGSASYSYGGGGGSSGGGGGGGGYGGFVTPQSQWTPQTQNKYAWQGGDPQRQAMLNQIDWSAAGAQSAQHKAQMIEQFMKTGVHPGTGKHVGGGGAGGGGYGGGGVSGGSGSFGLTENIGAVSKAGSGLMDPSSDYYKQLSAQMQRQIGGQTEAGQRAAALRGAWSGLGAGASPEVMMTQADLGQAGLKAAGQAQANLALQAPGMGAQMLGSTFNPLLGMEQLSEQSKQYGHGSAESARQFGVGAGLQQQQLAAQQAWQQAQLQQNQQQMAQQAAMQQQQNQLAMMQMMAGGFGGF